MRNRISETVRAEHDDKTDNAYLRLRETLKEKLETEWSQASADFIRNDLRAMLGESRCDNCEKEGAKPTVVFGRSLLLCDKCTKLYRKRENSVKGLPW